MKKIAIVTGASSGMGRIFAKTAFQHADFEELWVIARREDRLKELENACGVPVKCISMDLSSRENFRKYEDLLSKEQPDVRLLVQCSGFGKFEATMETKLSDNLNMVDLNCGAVLSMAQLTIPYMQPGASMINIASVAAFQPTPYINVYAATKAFVLSFSRALNRELKAKQIRVMALCPFWTKTEFFSRAIDDGKEKVVKKYVAMYEPEQLVTRAWRDLKRKKDVSQFGFMARLQAILCKILPHSLVMSAWMNQQKLK